MEMPSNGASLKRPRDGGLEATNQPHNNHHDIQTSPTKVAHKSVDDGLSDTVKLYSTPTAQSPLVNNTENTPKKLKRDGLVTPVALSTIDTPTHTLINSNTASAEQGHSTSALIHRTPAMSTASAGLQSSLTHVNASIAALIGACNGRDMDISGCDSSTSASNTQTALIQVYSALEHIHTLNRHLLDLSHILLHHHHHHPTTTTTVTTTNTNTQLVEEEGENPSPSLKMDEK